MICTAYLELLAACTKNFDQCFMAAKKDNTMKHLAKFERFNAPFANAPTRTKPGVKPTTRPTRRAPSPIRRDRPSVNPKPNATVDDVLRRYEELMTAQQK